MSEPPLFVILVGKMRVFFSTDTKPYKQPFILRHNDILMMLKWQKILEGISLKIARCFSFWGCHNPRKLLFYFFFSLWQYYLCTQGMTEKNDGVWHEIRYYCKNLIMLNILLVDLCLNFVEISCFTDFVFCFVFYLFIWRQGVQPMFISFTCRMPNS